jgi:hypothetical protein
MTNDARTNAPHLVLGLCFIALGAALLLDRLGIVDIQQTMAFWPLALVLLGASLSLEEADRIDHRLDRVVPLRLLHPYLLHAQGHAPARRWQRPVGSSNPAGDRKGVSKEPVSVGNRDGFL